VRVQNRVKDFEWFRGFKSWLLTVVTRLSHSRSSETWEIGLFRVTQIAKVAIGCPIAL
jgi:hypothetical protein